MQKWSNKSVLVTGACGFIGSHLVERLVRDGAKVRAYVYYNSFNSWGWLDRVSPEIQKNFEVIAGDVRDLVSVAHAMKGCEYVFHLAALIAIPYSYVAPSSYIQTNIQGTMNIMQAARELGASKVIHTSTSETYGTALYTPIDEKHPLQGQSPYSASKIGADMIAESYCRSFGVPLLILRPFNTFGPRQSARAVIPTIMTQVLSGKQELQLGSLETVRDLTYVSDTVDGFIKAAEADAHSGEVVNLGVGKGITIGELASLIFDVIGRRPHIVNDERRIRPKNSEVLQLISNNEKAKYLLGWQPQVSLQRGLELTLDWMRTNLQFYKPDLYNI